jgi:transcriptional regulator with XRE-family HTH domain
MTNVVLARRSGLGIATVQRALSGDGNARLDTLSGIAETLGVELGVSRSLPITTMRERQARLKARKLVALVQGNAALEAQAVPEPELEAMFQRTVRDLLRGSDRALWAD